MDTIVTNLISSLGIPGAVFAIVYIIIQQKIISVLKASDIERMFFTHEKRFLYRLSYWLGVFIWTFLLFIIISALVFNKKEYFNINFINIVINAFVSSIIIATLILYIFSNNKIVIAIKEYISKNVLLFNIICFIFYASYIISMIYILISYIYLNNLEVNKEIIIVVNSFVLSIMAPGIFKTLIRIWLISKENFYYFIEDGREWYIIKPHEKEVLIGDIPDEEKCKVFKFINSNEIKMREIYVKKNVNI